MFLNIVCNCQVDIRENSFIRDSSIILPGVTIGSDSMKVISSVEEYIKKINEIRKGKKIFDHEYYIAILMKLNVER